jgi:hypothetical protein
MWSKHSPVSICTDPRYSLTFYVTSGLPLGTGKTTRIRSIVNLEQQLNELSTSIKEYQRTSTKEHTCVEQKVDQLVALVWQLLSASSVSSSVQTMLSSAGPVPSAGPNNKTDSANQKPTPELINIIQKVVAKACLCVGKKKGSADDNSFKVCTCPHFW